ncbi:ABC transporter substrate-binding protein [Dermatophilaceae bacterium Sec6.4]
MTTARLAPRWAAGLLLWLLSIGTTACGATGMDSTSAAAASIGDGPVVAGPGQAAQLRLGYFANVAHAVPVIGIGDGSYRRTLGATKLSTQIFAAGPDAVRALLAGVVDAAYIGPNPAITAFLRSNGEAVRIVAGAASGGAGLVVQPHISDVSQLAGQVVADPQRGGTQDLALKSYLTAHGLAWQGSGTRTVDLVSQSNAMTFALFKRGRVAAAWLPQPWVARLVAAGGRVLVNERSLWPRGTFATTDLVVSASYLRKYPHTVSALLTAQVATTRGITRDRSRAVRLLRTDLIALTGSRLPDAVLRSALADVDIGWDPDASTLRTLARHAVQVGVLSEIPDLRGIFDLSVLNRVLQQLRLPTVSDAGLDVTTGGTR